MESRGGTSLRRMAHPGFSLIELLLVLAVLAILAALLFPVLPRARTRATQTSCMSNLRQLATATVLYVRDYDATLPPSVAGRPSGALVTTYDLLKPYMKNQEVKRCPADQAGEIDLASFGLGRYSYSWNDALFAYQLPAGMPGPPSGSVVLMSQVPYPMETTIFTDGRRVGKTLLVSHRHDEGTNVAFLDGHIRWHARKKPPRGCTEDNYHVIPQ